MMEEWKDIEGYEGLYQVSDLGNVRSLNYNKTRKIKVLKPRNGGKGYKVVYLTKNGQQQNYYIHKLVGKAFLPNPENKPCIDHINTDKTDNRKTNLRWVTYQENSNNPISKEKHKNKVPKPMLGVFGEKHPNSIPILQLGFNGVLIKEWSCASEVQRELGYKKSYIGSCCKGKHNSAYGFKWQYKKVG